MTGRICLFIGLFFVFFGILAYAQNGLDSVIVEKYYVSNAADSGGSIGRLPAGSVTYRVYVDMQPGYKLQALYGVPGHELRISTSTSFFNNEDRGDKTPNGISVTNSKKNTVMLDSWFSVGATATGKTGVLKTEDTDGSIGNSNGILQNSDPSAGIPILTQDGMLPGSPESVTFVGFTTELDVFNNVSGLGNLFTTTNGSVASLNGSMGPTAANRVLVGQFTTKGNFSFKLNIQIGTPTGGVENYVAENPTGGEISIPTLVFPVPVAPTVSITAPSNGSPFTTGTIIPVTAIAVDADGTIDSVRFFVDGTFYSSDVTSPYQANWTSTVGTHTLTAVAVDNDHKISISLPVIVNITNNIFPSASITAPASSATVTAGNTVTITAVASDPDGVIASVEFFVDGFQVGIDPTSPYQNNWLSTAGTKTLTAIATDNQGGKCTTAAVVINVIPLNILPTVSITSPLNNATFITGSPIVINASASDSDGTIATVDFFINGAFAGTDATAPYQYNWTSSTAGKKTLNAVATDNSGAMKTSATITITVVNNLLPTVSIVTPTSGSTFTAGDIVFISANASDADGVISYVQFFVKGILVNIDSVAPYQFNWASYACNGYVTAVAIDNNGGQKISNAVTITVKNNVAPMVSISSPANGSVKIGPASLLIQATATDADGFVDSVEFYVNALKVGVAFSIPFQYTWMSVVGKDTLTAIAIDNHGMQKTSSNVIITVKDTSTSGTDDINSLSPLFNIYPNPASSIINMEILVSSVNYNDNVANSYSIYNMEGKMMLNKKLDDVVSMQLEKIDLSAFENGHYVIELSIDGLRSTKKIVKE